MRRSLLILVSLLVLLGFALAGQKLSHEEVRGVEAARVVDALGHDVERVSPALMDTGAAVGLLLLGSWLVGRLIAPIGLPKMLGFLLFGVVCGPSVLRIIGLDQLEYLVLVNDLAIALIALLAGAEIRVEFLRRSVKAVSQITVIEMLTVLVGTTAGAMLIVPRLGLAEGLVPVFLVSLLIGTVLITNSPAVLLAVITELRCRGEMTRVSLAVTVCKDLALVILFAIVLAIVGTSLRSLESGAGPGDLAAPAVGIGVEAAEIGSGESGSALDGASVAETGSSAAGSGGSKETALWLYLVQHLGGSIGVGLAVGLVMAWYLHRIDAHLPIFLVFSCFGIALLCEALDLETLIVAVIAGMLMENVWGERFEGFFETVEETSTPVFCVFFAVTGAKVDLGQVGAVWPWALALVLIRIAMVWVGTTAAARLAGLGRPAVRWLWTAFVPQAGISMALLLIVSEKLEGIGGVEGLFALIVGVITINLLVGPILVSIGLRGSGEAGASEEPETGDDREVGA